jgi:hypothetical protein
MADRLRVTELDFDAIKNNLKNFLRQQDTFTDYDFEGSGLSIILDILAYNTHYNAYYLNMLANESFLDTALLRDSVVSHAKTLGYLPHSKKSSVAILKIEATSADTNSGTLTIPRGFPFVSNQIDGKVYTFTLAEDITVTKTGNKYIFEDVPIHEGKFITYSIFYDQATNPKQIFEIPEMDIDIDTLTVSITPSVGSVQLINYERVTDVSEIDETSEVFFIQEGRQGKYQIYFGDDILGKRLPDGCIVRINYLVTSADRANKANSFVVGRSLSDSLTESFSGGQLAITVVSPSSGGSDRELVDSIKYNAPTQFVSQNRLVTYKDYEVFIKRNYPNIDSVSIWGGEDESPPIFGKVFISLKPKNEFFISEAEKQRLINTLIEPKSVVAVKAEIRDPNFLYLLTNTNVEYDKNRTVLTADALKSLVRNNIITYKNLYLNRFGSRFVLSKLQEQINDIDTNSIIGSETRIRVQKRFIPVLNTIFNYTIDFNLALTQGTVFDRITSTEFDVFDINGVKRTVSLEEVPKSFTGVNTISLINPGVGYTSNPTVTITGDGFGASARAIVVNGRINRIEVLNPGIDYTRATVTISGGGGFGGQAIAIIDNKFGKLRTVYYTSSAERRVVNSNAGSVDYGRGIIQLNDLRVLSTKNSDGTIRISSDIQSTIIQSVRNTILTVDDLDPASIFVNVRSI